LGEVTSGDGDFDDLDLKGLTESDEDDDIALSDFK
jgi:hypothetical protein